MRANLLDRLDDLEHDAWMELNPNGGMKAFQAHKAKLEGKEPLSLTNEILSEAETKRLRRLYKVK